MVMAIISWEMNDGDEANMVNTQLACLGFQANHHLTHAFTKIESHSAAFSSRQYESLSFS